MWQKQSNHRYFGGNELVSWQRDAGIWYLRKVKKKKWKEIAELFKISTTYAAWLFKRYEKRIHKILKREAFINKVKNSK